MQVQDSESFENSLSSLRKGQFSKQLSVMQVMINTAIAFFQKTWVPAIAESICFVCFCF